MSAKTHLNKVRVLKLGFTAAIGAVLGMSVPCLAQDGAATNAATAPQADPQMRSPFWGDDYGMARRPYDRHDRYYDDYYDQETFAESFPVDLVGLIAPARARYIALRWTHMQTRRQIKLRVDAMRHALENSQEYRDLARQRHEATQALDDARRSATAALQDDPQYQALLDLENQLAERIAEAHKSPYRDLAAVRAMSEVALNYARQRGAMEAGLVRNDSAISSAQQRVRELGEMTRAMEDQFDQSVLNDPELLVLRQQLPLVKTEFLAAGGYYDEVVRSANEALRFAYFDSLASAGYFTPVYPRFGGYGYPWGGGTFPGGGFVVGGVSTGDSGEGPVRLRPTIFPTPILSNTFRGVNQVPVGYVPTGQDAPPIPVPESPPQ